MNIATAEVREIAKLAFPDYTGKKFKVEAFQGPMRCDSYWSEGSRDYWVVLNLETGKSEPIPENGTPFSNGGKVSQELPINGALVLRAISRGVEAGITIYLRPENIRADMLPAPVDLDWKEKVVLSATRSLKSTYAGIKNYRFHEANERTGIALVQWEVARARLIERGLLNKAGAITDEGKNAIGWTDLSSLKPLVVA
jgi:hypothetical protein